MSTSSSSQEELEFSKLLPFNIDIDTEEIINDLYYHHETIFSATGPNGIIKRYNGHKWETFFITNDEHVLSLTVHNNFLYASTSSNEYLYKINLNTSEYTSMLINDHIIKILVYKGKLMLISKYGNIYFYNIQTNRKEQIYTVYANVLDAKIIDEVVYIMPEGPHIITYQNGQFEKLPSMENVSSYRNIINEISLYNSNELNRENNHDRNSQNSFDVFPKKYSKYIRSLTYDGKLLMGGTNGAIYIYDEKIKQIAQPSITTVNAIENIEPGINLAAIDNILYLIHSKELPTKEDIQPPTPPEPDVIPEPKNIVITNPQNGDRFAMGNEIAIQWSSTRNFNDAIKIELHKGQSFYQTISSQTSNNGTFNWTIPFSVEVGTDYQIYIEWLSSTVTNEDKAYSGVFKIKLEIPADDTGVDNENQPQPSIQHDETRSIPIMVLQPHEKILKIFKNTARNNIHLLTSENRILESNVLKHNAYLTGYRKIHAGIKNGMGYITWHSRNFLYALHNKIIQLSPEKEIKVMHHVEMPCAVPFESVTGIFTSQILKAKEDIDKWHNIILDGNITNYGNIIVRVKNGHSIDNIQEKEWECGMVVDTNVESSSEQGNVISLENYHFTDNYLQFQIEINSISLDSPFVTDFSINYTTKYALYFFSNIFEIKSANMGLVTAFTNEPLNTEIQIGISNQESSKWEDYKIIETNKFFNMEVPASNIKVGIKYISYDDINVPSTGGISLILNNRE